MGDGRFRHRMADEERLAMANGERRDRGPLVELTDNLTARTQHLAHKIGGAHLADKGLRGLLALVMIVLGCSQADSGMTGVPTVTDIATTEQYEPVDAAQVPEPSPCSPTRTYVITDDAGTRTLVIPGTCRGQLPKSPMSDHGWDDTDGQGHGTPRPTPGGDPWPGPVPGRRY